MNVPFLQDTTFTGLISTKDYGTSQNWSQAYNLVQANSATWEESSEVIPTVTAYLSTNFVTLCSTDSKGQILSAGVPLHNIFLTSETDSQTLSYIPSSYLLSISNGNTVNLSSINSLFGSVSGNYESVYSNVQSNSANWNTSYSTVCALSSNWPTNLKILKEQETNLDAHSFGMFVKTVSSGQTFTYSNFTSGQTIAIYLSANHDSYFYHYFPNNTRLSKAGEGNAAITFNNTITRVTIQNIGNQFVGVANIVPTDIRNTENNITLEGVFGFLLQEDDFYLLQE